MAPVNSSFKVFQWCVVVCLIPASSRVGVLYLEVVWFDLIT